MNTIHEIQDYEKIAAGEVIERPASVVKELIENSIDAGASRIEVHVEDAGKKLIKVIDNGRGIPPDEVKFAFHRHTTSKIRGFQDIYNLSTLGFRGEALASIKAIAKVEIITRTKDNELGRKVVFEGDACVDESEVSCPVGTTISVKHLFYNVPVRRRFLKSKAVEFSHISDIITRYALAYHELDIKLFHDGRKVIDAPPSQGNLLNTIVSIYGRDHAKNMIKIDCKSELFELHGYIANPSITRSSRVYSSLFVNNRYIYSSEIAKTIESAYHGRLMKGRYPFYILFLDVEPSMIDVNIHPTKKEIKFYNEDDIYKSIHDCVLEKLEKNVKKLKLVELTSVPIDGISMQPGVGVETADGVLAKGRRVGKQNVRGTKITGATKTTDGTALDFDKLLEKANRTIPSDILRIDAEFNKDLEIAGRTGFRTSNKKGLDLESSNRSNEAYQGTFTGDENATRSAKLYSWQKLDVDLPVSPGWIKKTGTFRILPKMKSLHQGFQLKNTFLIFEGEDGTLLIVDQHAASERVEYEKLKKRYKTEGVTYQEMLIPKKLDLSPSLAALLDGNLEAVKKLGFDIRKEKKSGTGKLEFFIYKFPNVFHKQVEFHVIEDFLEDLLSLNIAGLNEINYDIIKIMACHAAIRAGQELTPKEVWKLLYELDSCDDPYHCCHGRPTFIKKPFSWLEKEFKRIL
ncbi:MAG: DNA mismatch repair endonuclease MutL [Promethearchaeota archaeon]